MDVRSLAMSTALWQSQKSGDPSWLGILKTEFRWFRKSFRNRHTTSSQGLSNILLRTSFVISSFVVVTSSTQKHIQVICKVHTFEYPDSLPSLSQWRSLKVFRWVPIALTFLPLEGIQRKSSKVVFRYVRTLVACSQWITLGCFRNSEIVDTAYDIPGRVHIEMCSRHPISWAYWVLPACLFLGASKLIRMIPADRGVNVGTSISIHESCDNCLNKASWDNKMPSPVSMI
jgi:hypothetical protein